jgi:chitinase
MTRRPSTRKNAIGSWITRPGLSVALLLTVAACTTPAEPEPDPAPAAAAPKVVGYFTNWGTYARDFQVKDLESSGAAAELTHLLYAFGKVADGKCAPNDAWADYEKPTPAAASVDGADTPGGAIGQLKLLKARHPQLKVLWSFGGWNGSAGFTEAAGDPEAFAASCQALLNDQRWAGVFDGIDIDWEYPNACGKSCDESGPDALPTMLAALRPKFGLVSAAVAGDVGKLAATDYAAAATHADWLSAMTYDFAGTGSTPGPTAAHSPLTTYEGIPRPTATSDATIQELRKLGVPPAKVLLGVGFYGRGWTGVTSPEPGAKATGPAKGTYEAGLEDYRVLADRCPPTGTIGGTSYATCGDQWWSYDTPETITGKMGYARENGLGGAFAWELSGDTDQADLLKAMAGGLS